MSRRYFAHGELPLVLVALLDQHPRHGYDLMSELSRLFAPRYRPSPGAIYPALEALAAEGLIAGSDEVGRTVWRTTAVGRRALAERRDALAGLELRTGVQLTDDSSLEPVLARFAARLMPLSHRVNVHEAAAVLEAAAQRIEDLLPDHDHHVHHVRKGC